ncbi:MAG: FapA family protein [Syntrophobacteraceae bacterium]|jgi:hypothetical protein|nr:FapA family protein [Syntrophobacteraceae bacterium]
MASGDTQSQRQAPSAGADDDRILARLALKNRMVTEKQIDVALALRNERRASGEPAALGDVLLHLESISARQLKLLTRALNLAILRKPDRLFGRIALRNGLVTQESIDEALRQQTRLYKETGQFAALGDLLHQGGLLSARHLKAINAAIARCQRSPSHTCSRIETQTSEPPGPEPPADAEPAEATDDAVWMEMEESALEVQISPDGLVAFLRVNRALPAWYRPRDLEAYLRSRGINFGILDDEALRGIILQKGMPGRAFEVARGIPPEPSRPAEIRFLVDSSLAGGVSADDAASVVDLKDRGMIPQVRGGDVLAEKTPAVPGIDGVDVHGQEIPVRAARDLPLLVGPGAELSPDRLQALARVDGRPQISAYGRISVLPELYIPGDVSFETGNIEFAGSVLVGGVVQDGFKVKAGSLIASEVGKAEIDVEGDVMAFGGILGARIRTQASVKGMHIHASHVEAMGDVVADRGIVDSRISTSGKCVTRRGTILSSIIVARRGIEAQNIGSDRSKPCALGIGYDPIAEKQAEACRSMLAAAREEYDREDAGAAVLKERLAEVERRIGELAQEQDRAIRQQRGHLERIADADEAGFAEEAASLRRELEAVEAGIEDVARMLEGLLEDQDQLKSSIARHKERMREIGDHMAQLTGELSTITDWAVGDSRRPMVKVHGKICAGTSIRGPCASVTLREGYTGAAFGERAGSEAGGSGMAEPRIVMKKLGR